MKERNHIIPIPELNSNSHISSLSPTSPPSPQLSPISPPPYLLSPLSSPLPPPPSPPYPPSPLMTRHFPLLPFPPSSFSLSGYSRALDIAWVRCWGKKGMGGRGKGGGEKEGNDPHSFALFIVFAEIWRQYLHS